MKNFLILFFLTLSNFKTTIAQPLKNILSVRLSDNSPISIAIDNRYYDREQSEIIVRNFPRGRHTLRVYRWSNRAERNYQIYSGEIFLKSGVYCQMVIDRRRRIPMIKYASLDNQQIDQSNAIDDRVSWKKDTEVNWNRRYDKSLDEEEISFQPKGNNSNQQTTQNQFGNNDMSDLQKSVQQLNTDTEKYKLIKNAVANRGIETEQISEMLTWLSFESTKMDVAKWFYNSVIDSKNYWKLEASFSMESSKSEFNDFLNSKKFNNK